MHAFSCVGQLRSQLEHSIATTSKLEKFLKIVLFGAHPIPQLFGICPLVTRGLSVSAPDEWNSKNWPSWHCGAWSHAPTPSTVNTVACGLPSDATRTASPSMPAVVDKLNGKGAQTASTPGRTDARVSFVLRRIARPGEDSPDASIPLLEANRKHPPASLSTVALAKSSASDSSEDLSGHVGGSRVGVPSWSLADTPSQREDGAEPSVPMVGWRHRATRCLENQHGCSGTDKLSGQVEREEGPLVGFYVGGFQGGGGGKPPFEGGLKGGLNPLLKGGGDSQGV